MSLIISTVYFLLLLLYGIVDPGYVPGPSLDFTWLGVWVIFRTTLLLPVVEELTLRYWIYGRNSLLRASLFFAFIAEIITSGLLLTGLAPTWSYGFALAITPLIVGSGTCFFLRNNGSLTHSLVGRFDVLEKSWVAFTLVALYGVFTHLSSFEEFGFSFFLRYINTIALVYIAKRYGMKMAIWTHVANNTIALFNVATILRTSEDTPFTEAYYFPLLTQSILLFGVYCYLVYRWRKSKTRFSSTHGKGS